MLRSKPLRHFEGLAMKVIVTYAIWNEKAYELGEAVETGLVSLAKTSGITRGDLINLRNVTDVGQIFRIHDAEQPACINDLMSMVLDLDVDVASTVGDGLTLASKQLGYGVDQMIVEDDLVLECHVKFDSESERVQTLARLASEYPALFRTSMIAA